MLDSAPAGRHGSRAEGPHPVTGWRRRAERVFGHARAPEPPGMGSAAVFSSSAGPTEPKVLPDGTIGHTGRS